MEGRICLSKPRELVPTTTFFCRYNRFGRTNSPLHIFVTISAIGLILLIGFISLLPEESILENYSFSQQIFDSNGKLLRLTTSSDEKYRIFTPLSEFPEHLKAATLEQEDRWFYFHPGVNPLSIVRATFLNLTTSRRLGASTISMQLARLKYRIYTRSMFGKLKQIFLSCYLEARYSKSQILETYLNLAPYGGNIEGVGAASLVYFSKLPSQMNLSESVSLSVIPQNPNRRRLNNLNASKAFDTARIDVFKGVKDQENYTELRNISFIKSDLPFSAPHLANRAISEKRFKNEIRLSLNSELQKGIERISSSYIKEKSSLGVKNTAVLLISNHDLLVRAYLGSVNFFDTAISGQVDLVQSRRSPGSALKPFIYALALDKGLIHPGSILKDAQFSRANYNPENFDKEFLGPIQATEALIRSRNSPAVALLNDVGPEKFLDFLKSAGVKKLKDSQFYGLTLALGGEEIRIDELASLYAGLANGGEFGEVRISIDDPVKSAVRLLSPEAAFLTLEMLATNPRPLEGLSNYSQDYRTLPIPWKTGTSFGFRDAWAAGIVGEFTLVVWLGNADSKGNPEFIGRELAGPLFFRLADYLIKETGFKSEYAKFRGRAKKVNVCAVSGELPGPYCKLTRSSWFIPGKSPIGTCSVHREIEVKEGRRLCPGEDKQVGEKKVVEKKVYEFWSSDLMELFKRAGLPRAQPPLFPISCNQGDLQGKAPLISSPSGAIEYISTGPDFSIPLSTVLDGASGKAYWFIDDSLFSESISGQTLFWNPKAGEYLLRVVDDQGRANSVLVKVIGAF